MDKWYRVRVRVRVRLFGQGIHSSFLLRFFFFSRFLFI